MVDLTFPPGRPSFIKPGGGRPTLAEAQESRLFSDELRRLYDLGHTLQELADLYGLTVHPVWRRIQCSRDRYYG